MARPLRIEFAGALYHLTSRGNERRTIFRSDRDRKAFLVFLGLAARRFGWSVTAWVLMTNHYHLVVQTLEPNLSRGMHWLNSAYGSIGGQSAPGTRTSQWKEDSGDGRHRSAHTGFEPVLPPRVGGVRKLEGRPARGCPARRLDVGRRPIEKAEILVAGKPGRFLCRVPHRLAIRGREGDLAHRRWGIRG
jgi:REP element-mobilizing transposase RayT